MDASPSNSTFYFPPFKKDRSVNASEEVLWTLLLEMAHFFVRRYENVSDSFVRFLAALRKVYK